ncbi:MAG: LytTR family transcriptional regulator [Williamsia sp.]|nr:LytTR family transcriptional regulator [Williamsia sp.]
MEESQSGKPETIIDIKRQKLEKLVIPTVEGCELVDINSILYLEANKSYTHIHIQNIEKPLVSSKSLQHYERDLQKEAFLRIHNSYIINVNRLTHYVRGDSGHVLLQNVKSPIPVSKSKKNDLLQLFGLKGSNNG